MSTEIILGSIFVSLRSISFVDSNIPLSLLFYVISLMTLPSLPCHLQSNLTKLTSLQIFQLNQKRNLQCTPSTSFFHNTAYCVPSFIRGYGDSWQILICFISGTSIDFWLVTYDSDLTYDSVSNRTLWKTFVYSKHQQANDWSLRSNNQSVNQATHQSFNQSVKS